MFAPFFFGEVQIYPGLTVYIYIFCIGSFSGKDFDSRLVVKKMMVFVEPMLCEED